MGTKENDTKQHQGAAGWAGRKNFADADRKDLTSSGMPLKPIYTKDDVAHLDPEPLPGQYPFTRGIHPDMYRSRLWTRRQYAGFGTGEDSNAWFRSMLKKGQNGLSIALDLPTQMGMNSDNPLAAHEVGRVGVAIDSLADMERLFEEIPLDKISAAFTINGVAAIILAMYLVVAEKQGVAPKDIRGTIQNDILKEYVARGTYIFPPKPSLRLVGDAIEFCITKAPKFNPISIAAGHMKSAGGTHVQTDAFMLANSIEYIEEVCKRGYSIDQFAHQFSFLNCCSRDFFESICRLRAMRKLWAKITKERFDSQNPKTQQMRIHAGGDTDSMTFERPNANIARIGLYCLGNILGGIQSMQLPCYDEAYEIPTQDSIQNALDVQMIVAYESGATNVVDPLAGSYFIENLTDEIIQEMEKIIDDITSTGGMAQWISEGKIQRIIAEEAYLWEKAIKSGEEVMVAANYARDDKDRAEYETMMHPYNDDTLNYQKESIATVKKQRNDMKVQKAAAALKTAADGEGNLMGPITDMVRAYATVEEICSVLSESFGDFQAPTGV